MAGPTQQEQQDTKASLDGAPFIKMRLDQEAGLCGLSRHIILIVGPYDDAVLPGAKVVIVGRAPRSGLGPNWVDPEQLILE